ncbi:MAG TPA: vanadium-dependent haloperoxidase, partial [Candidatus Udaeobacter sp.]|nr:vanadium-dependent haloperoxidase [Candidatus Udaeobacter sp.]
ARSIAMVHVAVFDAVNSIQKRYTPYKLSVPADSGASSEAAAAAAAHFILVKLFPDQQPALDMAYASSLASIADDESKSSGVAIGEKVAAEIFALRSADGSNAANMYKPTTAPGVYVPTTLPVSTDQPLVKPWLLESGAQFRPAPPPALTSQEWARDYNEIKDWGGVKSTKRTTEQSEVARFWIVTGPASWNPVVRQLLAAKNLSLIETARLLALVHMAGADALIAVFDAKYAYNFWRPVTAIRNGDIDNNDDTTVDLSWNSLVDAPMHPEYPCAHCITSAAVATVLEAEFGAGSLPPITMTSPTAPGVTRRWTRINDYVEEIGHARIWGGIHYRNSVQVGQAMGRRIGELALTRYLKPSATFVGVTNNPSAQPTVREASAETTGP